MERFTNSPVTSRSFCTQMDNGTELLRPYCCVTLFIVSKFGAHDRCMDPSVRHIHCPRLHYSFCGSRQVSGGKISSYPIKEFLLNNKTERSIILRDGDCEFYQIQVVLV